MKFIYITLKNVLESQIIQFKYSQTQHTPKISFTLHHLLKMEPTQCSETSAFNIQTPGKYPEDNLSLQHGESLKTRNKISVLIIY
jgi:hypothetical protein